VDVTSLLMVLAVLIVFGLIVFWMIWSERRGRQDRRKMALTLGFEPVEELDEATASLLIRLHQHTDSQEIQVHDVSERREGTARFLIFNLVDHSGDSNSTLVDRGVAVLSSELAMPRFSLIPRVTEKGRLADLANRVLEMIMEKRANRIELNVNPHFEERYFLLGNDESAVTGYLDAFRLSHLSQETYRHLEVDEGCFTYSRFVFSMRDKRNVRSDLESDLVDARRLYDIFRS
jgi:hypothetical protein